MNRNNLYLYWRETGPLLWSCAERQPTSGLIDRDAVAAFVGDRHLTVVLPCRHITRYEVKLTARSDHHIRASLPYAVEEDLASEAEQNHFAYRRTSNGIHAAVISHDAMQDYLQQIQTLNLRPEVLLPEACLLSSDEQGLILRDEGFFIQLSGGSEEALGGRFEVLSACLQLYLNRQQDEYVCELPIWDLRQTNRETIPALYEQARIHPVYQGDPQSVERTFAHLLQNRPNNLTINLLQGQYDQSGALLSHLWRAYQYVIYLGLLVFAIGLSSLWLRTDALKQEHRHLTQQAEQIYRSVFPKAKHVEDPKIQMQQQLQRMQDHAAARASDFVAMLANVGTVLQRYGKGKIDRMTFQKGKLRIDLLVDSQHDIDQITKQLRQLPEIAVRRGPIRRSDALYRTNIEMTVRSQ